ncbi:uncharacterized protein LOC114331849 [Diabrotica virgifera virgifera]|uniref:Uncharacterized protein n=3 Tax=Diabrotica virgifera virgifera TaxID=50390 RepID=A0ABM5INH2_DIAVI|nr:uncharacterized protein LOC114331849 [Diabrotica virgifera virgifera]
MLKSVNITYPNRRQTAKDVKVIGLQEPVRRTMYDIVKDNFKTIQRTDFLMRIVYIGEHTFPIADNTLNDFFLETVTMANDNYQCSEKITGLFVRYAKHFIHLLEGDEIAIHLHLKYLFRSENHIQKLKNMRLLVQINHVHSRLLCDWQTYSSNPAKLLENIDAENIKEETGRQIFACVKKMYDLIEKMSTRDSVIVTARSELGSIQLDTLSLRDTSSLYLRPSLIGGSLNYVDFYRKGLPEIERLDFIIKSPFPIDLHAFKDIFGVVPQRDIYKDKVWPVPADFIPYDIFDKLYDIRLDFPKSGAGGVQESEVEEEHLTESDISTNEEKTD